MKPLKEIRVIYPQLYRLFNEQELENFSETLKHGLFCFRCMDVCHKGLAHYSLRLDTWNNVVVDGKCLHCANMVCRVLEYGQDPVFYSKAIKFRLSLQN